MTTQEKRTGRDVKAEMDRRSKENRRGPNGRRICICGCEREIPKGKQRWHGQECVDKYLMQVDPGHLRRKVYRRDRGVCSLCFIDTNHTMHSMENIPEEVKKQIWESFAGPGGSWWQADHIVPVVEGGKNEIANMRTLCTPCHKGETKKLAERLAKRRQNAKNWKDGHER